MSLKFPLLHHASAGKQKSGAKSFGLKLYRLSYFTGRHARRIARAARSAGTVMFNVALSELVAKAGDMARNLSDFQRSRAGFSGSPFLRGGSTSSMSPYSLAWAAPM